MTLTSLQGMVIDVLRQFRSPHNFVGGGAALNRQWPRLSDDMDIFADGQRLSASVRPELQALRQAGFAVEEINLSEDSVDVIVKQYGFETHVQWMDEPETSKRFFPAVDDDKFGFRLHQADNAVNKVLCTSRRSSAARDAIDLIQIAQTYSPLGPLIWAACGKDQELTPAKILRGIRTNAFGYADEELRTVRTTEGESSITRRVVRDVLGPALDAASEYCDQAPTEFAGCLFVSNDETPVEATAENIRAGKAKPIHIKDFRALPRFVETAP